MCVVAGALDAMGEAVATRFADEGGIVVGLDRRPHSIGVLSVEAELTNEDEVRAACNQSMREFGQFEQQQYTVFSADQAQQAIKTGLLMQNSIGLITV